MMNLCLTINTVGLINKQDW